MGTSRAPYKSPLLACVACLITPPHKFTVCIFIIAVHACKHVCSQAKQNQTCCLPLPALLGVRDTYILCVRGEGPLVIGINYLESGSKYF